MNELILFFFYMKSALWWSRWDLSFQYFTYRSNFNQSNLCVIITLDFTSHQSKGCLDIYQKIQNIVSWWKWSFGTGLRGYLYSRINPLNFANLLDQLPITYLSDLPVSNHDIWAYNLLFHVWNVFLCVEVLIMKSDWLRILSKLVDLEHLITHQHILHSSFVMMCGFLVFSVPELHLACFTIAIPLSAIRPQIL